jgi:two-component system, chemotaxis family, protein-glutamate methylesterase/glutaminase
VVIGGSAGGISAVTAIVAALPPELPLAVVVVLHQSPGESLGWVEYLGRQARLPVVEAEDKLPLRPGTVHCAPAGYHLLIETEGTLALSVDEKVNFARPSIDLLFASAADAFGPELIGIVLTGANADGARGLAQIAARGGQALVQSPRTAQWPTMPEAALQAAPQALVVDLDEIARALVDLTLLGDS